MAKKRKSILRIIRIVLAFASVLMLTVLFVNFNSRGMFSFLAKVQFIPALLAGNLLLISVLALLTFLFGRFYCSVICPLGIMQDFINWLTCKFGGKKSKMRFGYSKPHNVLRYTILVLYIVAVVLGVGSLMALLDPYANFGRIMTHIFTPAAVFANNLLAGVSDMFETETYVGINSVALSVAIVMFVLVSYLAVRGGRTYCNTICPVGSLLGIASRYSLVRINIDKDKCSGCGLCGRKCRAGCIDTKNHSVDYSRCVGCMDCIDNCAASAISYSFKSLNGKMSEKTDQTDESRRKFLSVLAMTGLASSKLWAKNKIDSVENLIEGKKPSDKPVPVSPFGSLSHKHLNSKCTACHLCIDKCPKHVLRPAVNEYGLEGIMQPVMDFSKGYCDYECTLCSEICPAGAITRQSIDEKLSTRIGIAEYVRENCILSHEALLCGACYRACPTGAISMRPDYNEPLSEDKIEALKDVPAEAGRPRVNYMVYPKIDPDLCIGCGACQYRCPSKAIVVQGFEVHK